MKALLINGSPHEHGCTYTALCELADTLEAEGIETELVQAGKTAHACNACASCKKTHRCVYDDLVNETAPKLAAADALVIGSPVYYASPAGGAISFMDRLFFSTPHIDKTMKVGAAVVSCRRGGNTATFDALNKYFTICGMPVASSQYWNMVYGNTPEEVRQDKEGLQPMRTLGRNMAFLMKSIALGKAQLGLPEKILNSPDRTGAYFMELLTGQKRELLYQVCLDGKGKLLTCRCIAKGTVSASAVHVRQVVENALYAGASTIILAHNHPSGVALPSDADVLVTHRIQEALAPLGIRLADHIIVADDDYVSMAESGFLQR